MEKNVMNTQSSLFFLGGRKVGLVEETLDSLKPHEVLVASVVSAISPGTEMLVYREQVPSDMAVDSTLESLGDGAFRYPLKYGYSLVGRVERVGESVSRVREGSLVFAFQPHESRFIAHEDALMPVPEDISAEDAVFLPNMETAINFLHDAQPLYGDQVAVFGMGVVGLLTSSLLGRFPLSSVVAIDPIPQRRAAATQLAHANAAVDPTAVGAVVSIAAALHRPSPRPLYSGADVVLELSGQPAALDMAVQVAGYDSRVVIGSWYGSKQAHLQNLGGSSFHRGHLRLITSQVSSIPPHLSGRWTKARRFAAVWDAIRHVRPADKFISHRFRFADAADAYTLIDTAPDACLQVLLTYP